jgi:hypothetical protein
VVHLAPDGRIAARVEADTTLHAAKTAWTGFSAASAGATATFAGAALTLPSRRRRAHSRPAGPGRLPTGSRWSDSLATSLISSAARAVGHPDDQARYAEEWAAELAELPAGWKRLRCAVSVRLLAPWGIRGARKASSASPPQQP